MNTRTHRQGRTGGRPRRRPYSGRPSHGRRRQGGGRKLPTFDPSQFINKNPVEQKEEVYTPKNTFTTFGLDARIEKAVADRGITVPSPIQDQAIPEIMEGRDVIGLAETGTGKTAAFLLPLIHKTLKEPRRQTLILAPTRELALQIEQELRVLSGSLHLYATVCVGGTNIQPQIRGLKRKNHFVIGTPGRVLDLINRGNLRTDKITTVILDEADRMLDMGFIHDMRAILSGTPKDRETLFFSATMTKEAEALVDDFLRNPVTISVKKKEVTNSIEQDVVPFGHHNKFETLLNLLEDESLRRVIIFGAMKHSVEKLAKELSRAGIVAESIHGNKSHGQRQRSLAKFKSGNARILVATDVAARGIHVDNVSHVINYDLPGTFEDYVHRIGRTGRGTKRGKALTFVPEKSVSRLKNTGK
ncbi:DEAD/DEAH box helicase [Candidatus Kaiserbacteria bacterium]|nr:DEAD/DEAH box helicase [Candidatus Kaiserbacteria bacterium]